MCSVQNGIYQECIFERNKHNWETKESFYWPLHPVLRFIAPCGIPHGGRDAEDLLHYCVNTLETDSFLLANTWTNAIVLLRTANGPIRGAHPTWRWRQLHDDWSKKTSYLGKALFVIILMFTVIIFFLCVQLSKDFSFSYDLLLTPWFSSIKSYWDVKINKCILLHLNMFIPTWRSS